MIGPSTATVDFKVQVPATVHPSTFTSCKHKFPMQLARSLVLYMESYLHVRKESDLITRCMVSHVRRLLPVLDENAYDGPCNQATAPLSTQLHVK
ncbi:hypothetical protein VNO77_04328 [Canavalia gladiata]|uniref:Uncharacterized protein n=1 Tax=Canavalia gladiata TaxID=3824 RepID=A0AAN9MWB6_CANGL